MDMTAGQAAIPRPMVPVDSRARMVRVEVRFASARQGPHAARDEDLLTYVQFLWTIFSLGVPAESGNKIDIKKIDPEPDSEVGGSARPDGVQGQALQNGEGVLFGLRVENAPDKVVLPLPSPAA